MLSTTLTICMQCHTCHKYLKETEHYFYGNECTECNHRRYQERVKRIMEVRLCIKKL
jgi:hypothetical protein